MAWDHSHWKMAVCYHCWALNHASIMARQAPESPSCAADEVIKRSPDRQSRESLRNTPFASRRSSANAGGITPQNWSGPFNLTEFYIVKVVRICHAGFEEKHPPKKDFELLFSSWQSSVFWRGETISHSRVAPRRYFSLYFQHISSACSYCGEEVIWRSLWRDYPHDKKLHRGTVPS